MLSLLCIYIWLENSGEIVGYWIRAISRRFCVSPLFVGKIMVAFRHASGFEKRVVRVRDICIVQEMFGENQIKIDGHDNILFATTVRDDIERNVKS